MEHPSEQLETCLETSNATLDQDFLESPAISLVDKPLDQFTNEEIHALVEFYRNLTKVPGARQRRMKDESVTIKTGRSPKKKYNDDDLA